MNSKPNQHNDLNEHYENSKENMHHDHKERNEHYEHYYEQYAINTTIIARCLKLR
jgi:hypothetical protein